MILGSGLALVRPIVRNPVNVGAVHMQQAMAWLTYCKDGTVHLSRRILLEVPM
jgi:hypothetical protein